MSNKLTKEQNAVLKNVLENTNTTTSVNALPGTGKTYLGIYTARSWILKHSSKKVLWLTYNADQKLEIRKHAKAEGEGNFLAENFDSFVLNFYKQNENDTFDTKFSKALDGRAVETNNETLIGVGLVIVDEAQDITPKRKCLINKIFQRIKKIARASENACLLLLGDVFQQVYAFQGCSTDFMMNPGAHFPLDHSKINFFRLTHTHRCTSEMVEWVNANMTPHKLAKSYPIWHNQPLAQKYCTLWGTGLQASRSSPGSMEFVEVKSLYNNNIAVKNILQAIKFGIERENILVLSYTRPTPRSPVFNFAQKLAVMGIPVSIQGKYTSLGDCDKRVQQNRILFNTLHSQKGVTKKMVVLFLDGFMEKKNLDNPMHTFAPFFVGCTRATEKLLVVHNSNQPYATLRPQPLKPENKDKIYKFDFVDLSRQSSEYSEKHLKTTVSKLYDKNDAQTFVLDQTEFVLPCTQNKKTFVNFLTSAQSCLEFCVADIPVPEFAPAKHENFFASKWQPTSQQTQMLEKFNMELEHAYNKLKSQTKCNYLDICRIHFLQKCKNKSDMASFQDYPEKQIHFSTKTEKKLEKAFLNVNIALKRHGFTIQKKTDMEIEIEFENVEIEALKKKINYPLWFNYHKGYAVVVPVLSENCYRHDINFAQLLASSVESFANIPCEAAIVTATNGKLFFVEKSSSFRHEDFFSSFLDPKFKIKFLGKKKNMLQNNFKKFKPNSA